MSNIDCMDGTHVHGCMHALCAVEKRAHLIEHANNAFVQRTCAHIGLAHVLSNTLKNTF